jgi:hypothetical protein
MGDGIRRHHKFRYYDRELEQARARLGAVGAKVYQAVGKVPDGENVIAGGSHGDFEMVVTLPGWVEDPREFGSIARAAEVVVTAWLIDQVSRDLRKQGGSVKS